jgi:hypothetical protein
LAFSRCLLIHFLWNARKNAWGFICFVIETNQK